MNGDFLALLPSRPPVTPAIAGSPRDSIRLEATTVFAFHCADGVLVAGDHRATAGNVVFSDDTEKILELDPYCLMGIAGSPATAFEMARVLQTTFEFYRRSQLQPMSIAAKMRALSRLLRDNLSGVLQGFGVVAPIFAGLDEAAGTPGIYFYDPLGAQFKAAAFASSGSGSSSVKSILHYQSQWGPNPATLSLSGATTLANRLLMTAAEYDTATGGVDPTRGEFATVKLLNRDGIRSISVIEQARFWEESIR